ncbi:electron transfer flavoprotein alpha subunit apoprotein [Fulvimarina manganoxydans]|uniref:Electron transfer flavoprotein alpha subunit apoprotein n=1 Tax=Fulvimarina manganoxydans TaxID=937218 RepID=A0A1W2D741_9HYPH|nr:electron transfer flavoprotein subunit alpha/FixB family protein [Fulvimarina manganoxydans]SMC93211.1 electron transfer flavoprotein alpha subunit apoprotein [Fulvimarina manganoxydans]
MSRPRIDPRAARASHLVSTAGALRPRLDLGRTGPVSPTGRPRRDPRREMAVSRVSSDGRPRFDRSHQGSFEGLAPSNKTVVSPAPAAPKLRIVAEPAFLVFAIMEAPGGRLTRFDRQLLGAAHRLVGSSGEGAVAAIAFSPIADLGTAGADRSLIVEADGASASGRARLLRGLVESFAPRHVLFAEEGESADLARRLSVSMGEPILTDVEHLGPRQAIRATKGRMAEEVGEPPRLMTLGEDRAAPYGGETCGARTLAFSEEAAPIESDDAILSDEFIPGDPARLTLSETDFVVSAGNGVTDFDHFRKLAAALKGTPGASRVVCDAGLMPREAQVGASGTVLAGDCYLALGIAGAPQHLQGIAACEHVIAVNTDLHAAMIERAGLSIIQDAQLVMPALLKLLEERGS